MGVGQVGRPEFGEGADKQTSLPGCQPTRCTRRNLLLNCRDLSNTDAISIHYAPHWGDTAACVCAPAWCRELFGDRSAGATAWATLRCWADVDFFLWGSCRRQ